MEALLNETVAGQFMDDLPLSLGERPVARCDLLGAAPYSEEPNQLSRPYLTASHKAALDAAASWMTAAGMAVRLDPMANLIGRYEGARAEAPALLIGSHIDSVRGGGRYDGALGVMLGVECVDALRRAGLRLPFAVEVIAFGDEEGSRFPASMLCSRAVAGQIDFGALTMADPQGVTLGSALEQFGRDPDAIAGAARAPGEVFAYLEPHIEQGPVLEAEDLPVGVVTGIAAQLRIKVSLKGAAGHAGTSPMRLRKDAIAAAAEAVLIVEEVCRKGPEDLRGTVGRLVPATSAYNVIAGEVEFGLDLRAASRQVRDTAAEAIRERVEACAFRRGVTLGWSVVQDLADCPCDPGLTAILAKAVEAAGIPAHALVSGAGHDAMAISALAPVAMLFIRCRGGVSHSPDEAVNPDDVAVAAGVMVEFIKRLANARPEAG
jgi:allantoate deiminase